MIITIFIDIDINIINHHLRFNFGARVRIIAKHSAAKFDFLHRQAQRADVISRTRGLHMRMPTATDLASRSEYIYIDLCVTHITM